MGNKFENGIGLDHYTEEKATYACASKDTRRFPCAFSSENIRLTAGKYVLKTIQIDRAAQSFVVAIKLTGCW